MSPIPGRPAAPPPPSELEQLRAQVATLSARVAALTDQNARLWAFVDSVRAELAEPGAITRAEITADLAAIEKLTRI